MAKKYQKASSHAKRSGQARKRRPRRKRTQEPAKAEVHQEQDLASVSAHAQIPTSRPEETPARPEKVARIHAYVGSDLKRTVVISAITFIILIVLAIVLR